MASCAHGLATAFGHDAIDPGPDRGLHDPLAGRYLDGLLGPVRVDVGEGRHWENSLSNLNGDAVRDGSDEQVVATGGLEIVDVDGKQELGARHELEDLHDRAFGLDLSL